MWNGLPLPQGSQGYTQFHGIIGGEPEDPAGTKRTPSTYKPELKHDLINLGRDRRIGIATSSLGQVQYCCVDQTKNEGSQPNPKEKLKYS